MSGLHIDRKESNWRQGVDLTLLFLPNNDVVGKRKLKYSQKEHKMDFEIFLSIISVIVSMATKWLTKDSVKSDIDKYYNITVKLLPSVVGISFKLAVDINNKQIEMTTSVVGLYYIKKCNTVVWSMIAISIGSMALALANKYFIIPGQNYYFAIALVYFTILLSYFAILTYRVKNGYFGSTNDDVQELLSFIYKNSDCINENNGNGGGKKLKIFNDAPENKSVDVPEELEGGVRI